jgi:polyribonucleotide nucleotidyltransferase
MVTRISCDSTGRPQIKLSERALTNIIDLPGSHVVGKVVNIKPYGVFLNIGDGFPLGLCHVSELAAPCKSNQTARLQRLRVGDRVSVVIVSVKRDTLSGRYRVELSEWKHYLQEACNRLLASTGANLADTHRR